MTGSAPGGCTRDEAGRRPKQQRMVRHQQIDTSVGCGSSNLVRHLVANADNIRDGLRITHLETDRIPGRGL